MSTALYRRYRPESFADVIGQEHVTEPLMTALEKNRVNHAYLFSGPRGCGKTTSARILARCLNCAQGPTPNPCGECESCRELSRDGGGSLDVIEMDAASHGGVDHARDLRERATFAPVRDRYKIFIIDEAHMVTREGFNALLKIVEEPPAHIKFIFATTEPNKVLGTIRSRTHHYPFRLVPPQILGGYLQQLCQEEGVAVADGVLPLVVRAGGGSVRDSLSILDQLMAGASDEQGISYDLAVALLGFTHGELLDEVIDAFASGSAAEVFGAVDKVIQTGQDPRRFVEDLLERFRDLIMVKAVPDAAGSILRGLAPDQLERLRAQAGQLGSAELSRAADITNAALNEMSGAMNPQLHLELLCARILMATGEQGVAGLATRVERLERKSVSGQQSAPVGAGSAGAGAMSTGPAGSNPVNASPVGAGPDGAAQGQVPQAPLARPRTTPADSAPAPGAGAPLASAPLASAPLATAPLAGGAPQQAPAQAPSAPLQASQQAPQSVPGENTVDLVRNSWADVVAQLPSPYARAQFALCEPSKFEGGALFLRAELAVLKNVKSHLPLLQQALHQVLGLQVQLRGEIKPSSPAHGEGGPADLGKPQGPQGNAPAPAEAAPVGQPPLTAAAAGQAQAAVRAPLAPQAQVAPTGPAASPQPVSAPVSAPVHQPPVAAPVAEGPRGGDQAWAAHGQPRSPEPPAWSQDDWNNPVTSWSVAPIPSGDPDAGPGATQAPAADLDAQAQAVAGQATPAPTPPVQGPGQEQVPVGPAGASAPAGPAEQGGQQAPAQQAQADSVQPEPGSGPVAPVPVAPAQGAPEPVGQAAEAPVAHEYADYEGGYFDDAPADEPEYVAGVGYLSPDQTGPEQPAQASQPNQESQPSHPNQPSPADVAPGQPAPVAPAQPAPAPAPAPASVPSGQPEPAPANYPSPAPGQEQEGGPTPVAPLAAAPLAGAPLAAPNAGEPSAGSPTASEPASQPSSAQSGPAQGRGGKLSFRERHAAQIAAGQRAVQEAQAPAPGAEAPEDFAPSDDDAALESAVLIGQRAVEKILGGKVIDEQPLHQG
ncbi:DNA polymerase III subunit gamma and tau [Rothia nasimurium]|uniref:DNA polymerase III subunit gamma and tau n=4 Tax=Rothia nasimurium TaxID=85336 RepID=UPI001F007B4A|nr:DNA polymerase III subunit gamma and tau [Rothia nasimurium]